MHGHRPFDCEAALITLDNNHFCTLQGHNPSQGASGPHQQKEANFFATPDSVHCHVAPALCGCRPPGMSHPGSVANSCRLE